MATWLTIVSPRLIRAARASDINIWGRDWNSSGVLRGHQWVPARRYGRKRWWVMEEVVTTRWRKIPVFAARRLEVVSPESTLEEHGGVGELGELSRQG